MTEEERRIAMLEGKVAGLTSYIAEVMARMPAEQAADAWEGQHFHPIMAPPANMRNDAFRAWQEGYQSIKDAVSFIMPDLRERNLRR